MRAMTEIEIEISKVKKAKDNAIRKAERCDERLVELGKEWAEAKEAAE